MNNNPSENASPTAPMQTNASDKPATPPAPAGQPVAALRSWPGAFGIYKYSKKIVKLNIGTFGILVLFSIVWQLFGQYKPKNLGIYLIILILNIIVNTIFTAAITFVWLAGAKEEKISVTEVLQKSVNFIWKLLVACFLVGVAAFVSIMLFVVPFFFVYPRLIFVPYLVLDKNLNASDALKKSWDMTKGHLGEIYGIFGATLAMALLSLTIIGIPFSIYFLVMYTAATVVLYTYISNNPSIAPVPVQAQQNVSNEKPVNSSNNQSTTNDTPASTSTNMPPKSTPPPAPSSTPPISNV